MKKLNIIILSLISLLFVTSCSNDEIEIETIGRKHSLTLNVNTQSLYDQFGLTYSIRETHLRDGGRCVGILTYVYNSAGDLVENNKTYLTNFNTANIKFDNLVEGKYTIITIETLLNPDDDYKADTWSFDDADKLSTFKITNKLEEPDGNGYRWSKIASAPEVIGVSSKDIELLESASINVVPEGIGAIVEFNQYYWDKSSFVTVGWATDDVLNYYSLNPSLNRDDRFVKNLTSSGKTHVRNLYDVDDDPTIYYGAYVLESEIDWKCVYQSPESVSTGNVYIGNSRHAILDDGKTYQIGCYFAGDSFYDYFGDEAGLQNWKTNLDNTVGPPSSSALFETPYTNWGVGTVSAVKSYMTNFYLFQDIHFDESYEGYCMTYFDNLNNMYDYVFTSSTSGLTDVYVWLDGDTYTLSKVREEVEKQGYTYNSQNNNNYYYTSSSTYVTIYQYSSGLIVVNYYNPKAYGLAPQKEVPQYNVVSKIQGINRIHQNSFSLSKNGYMRLSPATINKTTRKMSFK